MFKRVLILATSTACTLLWGCSGSYTTRMEHTLEQMKEQREYDKNLEQAIAEGQFQENAVFFRSPLSLKLAKDFLLSPPQPLMGKFEILASYSSPDSASSVHLFARKKNPKPPATKKGQPAPQPVARGPFVDEVRTTVTQVRPPADSKFDPNPKAVSSPRQFQRIAYDSSTGDEVEIDFFKSKSGDTDVALVFIDPKGKKNAKANNLSLKSFALGSAATRRFQGDVTASEDDAAAEGGASTGF